jgi:hypothetical protein
MWLASQLAIARSSIGGQANSRSPVSSSKLCAAISFCSVTAMASIISPATF